MSAPRDPEVDEANISYPSPGAEGMEAGPFYNTGGREGVPEHQDHTDHHVSEQVQVQEHDQGELVTEPATPQHHVSRPANLEELQLAAQLGQGLAGTPIMPATDPNMNVEDPNLRSIMPHPEPEPQHTPSYVQETPTTDSMVQHSMSVPVGPPMPPQYAMDNSIPPRKRSKVSRACDECRRKKIKYIKELADRIHSIENKLENEGGLSQDDLDHLFVPDRPRQNHVGGDDASRKRPFSSISGEFTTPAPARQTPWGSEQRSIQPSSAASDGYAAPFSTGSLAPQPSAIKPESTPSKPPVAAMDISMPDTDGVPDIDEDTLHSKARVQELLAQCPSSVRTAFANAILAVTMSSGDVKLASSLLNEWESSETPHSLAANIVHAQTLLLLVIEADWRSSPTLPFLLARAVALANSMKLWRYTPMESASEPDSDDQLCVRVWWSLILMDRWHAAGTGKPAQIPDSSVVAPPGLENILGEVCFYLVRLSKLLNRVSHVVSTLQPGSTTTEQPMAAILTDYIENYREDLPAHIEPASHPLVHLAYWHCKLLVALLTPGATPAETMWPTKELVNLLFAHTYLQSPLVNHFASLVAMSLAKLSKLESSREEATQLIKDIVEKPGDVWDGIRDKLSEQMRPTSSVEAAASQGLQHLADLATAHEGIAPGGDEIAFGPSLASGYLDVA
ncbi:hypothetical protein G7Z17_g11417 [Cylindrodendrum hubeiense]|uniref:Xylanolytic transcriptional activator regulatory domain-containing protein n=1 Tax=Cylindrodendrum hubeiense TaxID=595255 RepID=A0A9P5H406_9HYPO|nr:hypothetical protein G7Z17_g11417 [Cylindrodendrum hubeiense]